MNATKYGKYCTHVNTQLNVYFKHDVVGYQTDKSLMFHHSIFIMQYYNA